MDSAAAFDTVLIAPGEYVITTVYLRDGVVLTSETGAFQTRLVPHPSYWSGGLACQLLTRPTKISGFWLDGFTPGSGGAAINAYRCTDVSVLGCVFTGNSTAIVVDTDFGFTGIEGNTFIDNTIAINIYPGTGSCINNIIWGPAYGLGQYTVVCNDVLRLGDVPPLLRFANFSLDPQFCGVNDYRLMASSPCAPGNSPLGGNCALIGALPVQCNPTATEESTWGRVKALYWKKP